MKTTIYECCKPYKDVNKTLFPVYYADTERGAIYWLETHGGGVYRNRLHNFEMPVKADPDFLEENCNG